MKQKYFSYANLQQQKLLLYGLVLALIIVVFGVLLEVYYRSSKVSAVDASLQKLALPLTPILNIKVLDQMQSYEQLNLDVVKADVQNYIPPATGSAGLTQKKVATSSATSDIVSNEAAQNTLSPAEVLTDQQLQDLAASASASQTGSTP